MGDAEFDTDVSFLAGKCKAAAVLCRTPQGNLHAGILHQTGGVAKVLHLGWKDRLLDTWEYPRLWAAPEVEPEKLVAIAGHCRRIWRTYQKRLVFPYALAYCGSQFDNRGSLKLGPGSQGLTCATFILAVFQTAGITLVDENDWPTRKEQDLKFLESISSFAQPMHLELLKAEVEKGVKRIHPNEVLGACAVMDLPAKFAPTVKAAATVLDKLDGKAKPSLQP